jgi:hypothetical protein
VRFFAWARAIAANGDWNGAMSSSFLRLKTHFALGSGDGEDEHGADLGQPAHLHLHEPAHLLAPAKALLDAFADRCINKRKKISVNLSAKLNMRMRDSGMIP